MKKYSVKDQIGFSDTEKAESNSIPVSDQENLPNIMGGNTGGPSAFRNQNNYTNSNSRPVIEAQPRNQGFNTLNGNTSNSRVQSQYYDSRSEQPIYVPPYLLNQRPSRRHDYNKPLDYLAWSVANIFICVIIALPALFFSVQTRDLNRAGNVKKAKVNSRRSLILNIVASVVGLLTILLAVILRFALYQLFVHNDVNSQNVPIIIAGGR